MNESENLLIHALRDPLIMGGFSTDQWDICLRQARQARLLGRLCILLEQARPAPELPRKAIDLLEAARKVAADHERAVRWEVNRIESALGSLEVPVVLLKGAAYVMLGLPAARGRLHSDVDILVSKDKIALVESTLLQQGWEATKHDSYDDHYYRAWSHELPPLQHKERKTIVDIHHNILPVTGRLHPDPRLLLASAEDLPGTMFKVLAHADMLLHSAAHMFQDGELAGSLRDLIDLDDLLRDFWRAAKRFWEALISRARQFGPGTPALLFPLFRTEFFRYAGALRGDQNCSTRCATCSNRIRYGFLVHRALAPAPPDGKSLGARFAQSALYLRSHRSRMPPLLLFRHLLHKSFRRLNARTPEAH